MAIMRNATIDAITLLKSNVDKDITNVGSTLMKYQRDLAATTMAVYLLSQIHDHESTLKKSWDILIESKHKKAALKYDILQCVIDGFMTALAGMIIIVVLTALTPSATLPCFTDCVPFIVICFVVGVCYRLTRERRRISQIASSHDSEIYEAEEKIKLANGLIEWIKSQHTYEACEEIIPDRYFNLSDAIRINSMLLKGDVTSIDDAIKIIESEATSVECKQG